MIDEKGRVLRYVSDNVDPLAERIVQMAGYDMSIYIAKDVEMTQQA